MRKKTQKPIAGHEGLVRDADSGAIINVNSEQMKNARHRKKEWKRQQDEIKSLRDEVEILKTAISKIIEDKTDDNQN